MFVYTGAVPNDQSPDVDRAGLPDVGNRLRERRVALGMSLRELARRLSVSPSLISQIERSKVTPSVATLYSMTTALDLSLDALFSEPDPSPSATKRSHRDAFAELQASANGEGPSSPVLDPVVRPADRKRIQLDSGVRWERLTRSSDPTVDFLHVVYEPGGASCEAGVLMRHPGREYGQVLSGTLEVTVGFDVHVLQAGDAISFDSTVPHRLATIGEEPAEAIWLVVGRQGDPRIGLPTS
jgi:transcriptional regulator with XRE-family HTH domain